MDCKCCYPERCPISHRLIGLFSTLVQLLPSRFPCSQQALSRQLDLLCKLALSPTAPGPTYGYSLAKFSLVFYAFPCAGTVVWEVDTGQGARTEVVRALGCK